MEKTAVKKIKRNQAILFVILMTITIVAIFYFINVFSQIG